MRGQKTEIVVGIATASAEIAAIVAGSAGKVAVEQTMRVLRLPAAAAAIGRRALDSQALGKHLQEQRHEVSTEQAMTNFAVTLIEKPDDTEEHDRHFSVLVDKMKSIPEVTDGIRIGGTADGTVSSARIIREYVIQLVSLTEGSGADPQVVHSRLETLREVTGMGPDDQAYVAEQVALARLVDETRANVTSTL